MGTPYEKDVERILTADMSNGGMGMILPGKHYDGIRNMITQYDEYEIDIYKVQQYYQEEAYEQHQIIVGPAMNSWEPLPDLGIQHILRKCFDSREISLVQPCV